ncbi:MAG: ORF6N domain-containing protein [Bacteroidales bacterium]|nr:ORF6N domain-containing protein [Bacteroidales bacterium]
MKTSRQISFSEVEGRLIRLRDQNVLLDCAVAELYGVETKRVNEAVKNNPEKFPKGYVFEVTDEEMENFAVEKIDRKTLAKSRVAPKIRKRRTDVPLISRQPK